MKRNTDHCVYDAKLGALSCRHCGEAYPVHLPVGIDMLAAMGKAFASEHAHCKPTKNPEATP